MLWGDGFGGDLFQTVLAYLVILVVLSSLVSASLQVLDRALLLRHRWLRRCVGRLVVFAGLADRQPTGLEWVRELGLRLGVGWAAPGQLPPNPTRGELVAAFFASPTVNPSGSSGVTAVDGDATAAWLRAERKRQNDHGDVSFVPKADSDPEAWERWWASFERGATVGYSRLTVVLGFFIGLGLSLGLGLDAIGVARHLARSPATSAALVQSASSVGGTGFDQGGSFSSTPSPYRDAFRRHLATALDRHAADAPSAEQVAHADILRSFLARYDAEAASTRPEAGWIHTLDQAAELTPSDHAARLDALVTLLEAEALALAAPPPDVENTDTGTITEEPTLRDKALEALRANTDPAALGWSLGLLDTLALPTTPTPLALLEAAHGPAIRDARYWSADHVRIAAQAARSAEGDLRATQLGFAGVQRAEGAGWHLLGVLLFAIFVAGGAPIWFDLLNSLMAVRNGDALRDPS